MGVDLARTIALLGMFTAHLWVPSETGLSRGLFELVAGRASALFALLAGLSLVLVAREAAGDPWRHRARVLVRAALVGLVGLLLGSLNHSIAVILVPYALLFCWALPVLTWGWRRLAALATVCALGSPVVSMLLRQEIERPGFATPSLRSLLQPLDLLNELLLTGYYPVLTWCTYLFAGMALGRLDLRARGVGGRLALVGAWLAALSAAVDAWVTGLPRARAALSPRGTWEVTAEEAALGMHGAHPPTTWWWLGVWAPHSGTIVDLVHTTGCAFLVLGLCLALVRLLPAVPWRLLAGAGTMTLTLYAAHVLARSEPWPTSAPGSLQLLLVHVTVALATGVVFAALRWRGPLELLVSWATRLVPLTPGRPSQSR